MSYDDLGQRPEAGVIYIGAHHGSQINVSPDYSSLIFAGHAGPEHQPCGPREGRGGRDRAEAEKNEQSEANVL